MKKILAATLSALLTLVVATTAPAEELKPAAVLSISSYDGMLKSVAEIGKLAGVPGLDQIAQMQIQAVTDGKGLAGFDKTRPIGTAVFVDEEGKPYFLAFLPVNDFKALLDVLQGLQIPTENVGNGVTQIALPDTPPVLLKMQDKWLFITTEEDRLDNLPADPAKLLGDLPKTYDIAAQGNFQNVPQAVRKQWVDAIGMLLAMSTGLQGGLGGDDDAGDAFELQAKMAEEQIKQIEKLLNELDVIQVGFSLDKESKDLSVEMVMTAMPGTSTAQDMALYKTGPSKHAGFLVKDAPVSMLVHMKGKASEEAHATAQIQKKQLISQLENVLTRESGLPEETQSTIVKSVTTLIDSLFDTSYGGKSDGGMVLFGNPKPALVAGGTVSDPKAVEGAVKDLLTVMKAELAKEINEDLPEIQWNAKELEGLRLHQVTIPVPDEEAAQVLGEEIQILLAVGEESMFIAAGEKAEEALKTVLAGSKPGTDQPQIPMQMTVSVSSLVELFAPEDNLMAQMVVGQLNAVKGKDHVKMTATAVPNGTKMKFTIEPGLIKVMATMGRMF